MSSGNLGNTSGTALELGQSCTVQNPYTTAYEPQIDPLAYSCDPKHMFLSTRSSRDRRGRYFESCDSRVICANPSTSRDYDSRPYPSGLDVKIFFQL